MKDVVKRGTWWEVVGGWPRIGRGSGVNGWRVVRLWCYERGGLGGNVT
jgi:hypothetical protein